MANILVVDDDPGVLNVLMLALESAGHEVRCASSGSAALDVIEKQCSPDLLLTDVIMPGLNGFNLARIAHSRAPFMRVLYLTGFHERAIALRDQGSKLGKILTKPILPDDLVNEVVRALEETVQALEGEQIP